jgi:hypothetical protein
VDEDARPVAPVVSQRVPDREAMPLWLAGLLPHWDQRVDQALRRGDWKLAAIFQKQAAPIAHRLGLLVDGQAKI